MHLAEVPINYCDSRDSTFADAGGFDVVAPHVLWVHRGAVVIEPLLTTTADFVNCIHFIASFRSFVEALS